MSTLRSIWCVWLRYFDVYKKNVLYSMVTTFVEPILYLVAFGFGLGRMIGTVHVDGMEFTYRQFVFAGILGQTVLMQSFFEAAYGSFIRMYYQKIFQAIAVTPITLSEVLWAELLWDASKAGISILAVLSIGVAMGDFSPLGALVAFPFCFLGSLLFASLGILVAGKTRNIEAISYPQYLLIFPMMLFCSVFFPLQNLPEAVQTIVMFLPLTSVVAIIRQWVLGLPTGAFSYVVLIVWLAVLVPLSRRAMLKRLIK